MEDMNLESLPGENGNVRQLKASKMSDPLPNALDVLVTIALAT